MNMFEPVLSAAQVLQLIGLAQAGGGVVMLSARSGLNARAIVPALYFLALAGQFGALFTLALACGLPAATSLLVIQVVTDETPRPGHFAVLAAMLPPLVLIAIADRSTAACTGSQACFDWWGAFEVVRIFAAGIVLLVLELWVGRRLLERLGGRRDGREKYWLITVLTATLTLTIASDLLHVMELIDGPRALLVATFIALLFVYLVMTLLFRLLPAPLDLADAPAVARQVPVLNVAPAGVVPSAAEDDAARSGEDDELGTDERLLVERVRHLMEVDKVYQYPDYGRDSLARELAIPEHRAARLVRLGFGTSIGQLLRDHRLAEAKRQLSESEVPIGQLAFDAGFNSLPSFNRVFKAATGLSPSEYRSAHGVAAAPQNDPLPRPRTGQAS